MPMRYIPSENEMARAEEVMLPIQKELSEKRERVHQLLRVRGVEGWLISHDYDATRRHAEDPTGKVIWGEINGHKIMVNHDLIYNGTIDDMAMHPKKAREAWEKYHSIGEIITATELIEAEYQLRESHNPKNAEYWAANELLKDIL